MRLRILPLWMACPREGHPSSDYTIQLAGIERPSVSWRVSTFGCCVSRVSISTVVHGRRVSGEGRIYGFLVDAFPAGI